MVLCEPWWNPFAEEQARRPTAPHRRTAHTPTTPLRQLDYGLSLWIDHPLSPAPLSPRSLPALSPPWGAGGARRRGGPRLTDGELQTLFGG